MPISSTPRPGRTARLTGAAVAAVVATVAALALGSPSLAQLSVSSIDYVEQSGTVQLVPSTICSLPADTITIVQPTEAGTLRIGSNGCGLSFSASSTFTGEALAAVQSLGSNLSVAFGIRVVPAGTAVVQGDTVEVLPFSPCPSQPIPSNAQVAVVPPEAGVGFVRPNRCGIGFTASQTYLGPVAIGIQVGGNPGGGVQRTVIKAPPNFVKPSATANGSFTPITPPPPPGPCILISANPVVSFGDVTLGGPYRNGDVAPTVAGCAVASVSQDVLVQASSASNGQATLATDTSCLTPVGCTPGDGTYSLAIPTASLTVRSAPSLWLNAGAGNFSDQSAGLAVKMPATLAPTSVGSLFTFDVTFTAVTN